MSEYICPNCGKPINDDDALLCHFCGESLNKRVKGCFIWNIKCSKTKAVWWILVIIIIIGFIALLMGKRF